ncbi:helix-turn-helix domain-containing protein [Polaribacter vadi]|uniref:helix-turn-helix domain-containing protein n=1 Tax=Polaribacter TaxID=52959 RepID=UPI001C099F6D|nr:MULTISPECIES: helix-turn-helix transcriptional regulator [Polaribacter]MBU3010040.1 helix-turn-helix domain-containing protein [Polaribacter vadi]MDO6739847.1 helix-turn-helix transcriptional regulator [Polaribacter sp. 1_MG-2023]
MEEKLIAIRKKIKFARLKKEYSQYYMGCRLSTSQIAYHNLENGKSNIKIDTLLKIATILEVDVKDFFDFEELKKKGS